MTARFGQIETQVVHAGEPRGEFEGAVVVPIFQSSTYAYAGQEDYEQLKYIRLNNTPNHRVLHEKLATLENGEAALVAGSGMGAISSALLSVLSSGDHLLAQSELYGGTHALLTTDFPRWGIEFDFFDATHPDCWSHALKKNTKAVFVETITNPLMRVADLEAVVNFARQNGLISIIDNTFASPVNFKPLDLGFDLAVHSCTKYLNGHSDIVAGAIVGSSEQVRRANSCLLHLGAPLDPHACFLLQRGLKTLALRMRQHNQNALAIAGFLEDHPAVERVNYPGLKNHPDYERSSQLLAGFGGMLSVELKGGVEDANRFMGKLQLGTEAPSLGGVETLVTRPVTTSHSSLDSSERQRMGISDHLIRISVGIEGTADLIDDLDQALN